MEQVARARIGGIRTSVTRRDIFEELHARPRGCAQGCDSKPGAKDVVQVFLLHPVVLTFSNLLEAEGVSIEPEARPRVADDDRGVIDAEEQVPRVAMPLCVAFTGREREDLERMLVRILEVECLDSRSILVPLRQRLRPRGCVFNFVLTQPLISLIHIGYDNGNV